MISVKDSPNEITTINREYEHLFNRYGIKISSKKSIEINSYLNDLNPEFIIEILKCYESSSFLKVENFINYRIPLIIDYLKKSHNYYITKRLPEIEQQIYNLKNEYVDSKPLLYLFYNFFINYQAELCQHFRKEEEVLFPYAIQLFSMVNFNIDIDYTSLNKNKELASNFLKEHHQKEKNLKSLQNAILKYSPPSKNLSVYHIILNHLKNFQKDLNIHNFIEKNVLELKIISLQSYLKL
jgi:regulator of cell morphogenesis and NO signaling